jgi:hypothetical protein
VHKAIGKDILESNQALNFERADPFAVSLGKTNLVKQPDCEPSFFSRGNGDKRDAIK